MQPCVGVFLVLLLIAVIFDWGLEQFRRFGAETRLYLTILPPTILKPKGSSYPDEVV